MQINRQIHFNLAFFLGTASLTHFVHASEGAALAATLSEIVAKKSAPSIWWLRPTDERWSKFDFIEMAGTGKGRLLKSIESAQFSPIAGNYELLDTAFTYADTKGQGLIIIQDLEKKSVYGLRFRAISINLNAFQFADISFFSAESKEVRYSFKGNLEGVILKEDFRSILQEARLGPMK